MKAGYLQNWRTRLENANKIRIENSSKYFSNIHVNPNGKKNIPYLRFPLLLKSQQDRERILKISKKQGLGVSPMYPTTIEKIPEFKGKLDQEKYPIAEKVSESLVTLPTHRFLTQKDQQKICELLKTTDLENRAKLTRV